MYVKLKILGGILMGIYEELVARGLIAQVTNEEEIKEMVNSGKAKFMANGGKVGRKEGYKKPDETFQEEYATVIKQLRKGYPIRMIAKNCGVGISTVQRIKKKFIDNEQDN